MPPIEPVRNDALPAVAAPGALLRRAFGGLATALMIARLLFRANLRARHRRMLLGYAWLAIPGLVSAATFTVLRSTALIGTGPVGLPYPLFVLSGVFLWQSLGDGLNLPIQQLGQQRRFLSLVPAPFQAVLLAALGDALLNLAVRLTILAAVMAGFGLLPGPGWLVVAAAGLTMVLCGFALALLVAPFAQLFDDIATLAGMAVTFGMFLSPVFYPIPSGNPLALNPLAGILSAAREGMAGLIDPGALVPGLVLALILIGPGWLLNAVSRPHIAARAT